MFARKRTQKSLATWIDLFNFLSWTINIKDTIAKLDQKVQKINKKDV